MIICKLCYFERKKTLNLIVSVFVLFFFKLKTGQSQDATCDGLINPQEGARTFEVYLPAEGTARLPSMPECSFPPELTDRKRFSSLDQVDIFEFGNPHTLTIRNSRNKHQPRASFVCHQRNNPLAATSPQHPQQHLGLYSEYVIHSKSGW